MKTRLYLFLAVVFLSVSAFVWWRLNRISLANDPVEYTIRQTIPRLQSLHYTHPQTAEDVRQILEQQRNLAGLEPAINGEYFIAEPTSLMHSDDEQSRAVITRRQVDLLINQLAEIIYFRLLSDDPDAYVASREAHGATAPDDAGLQARGWESLDTIIQYFYGRPASDQDSIKKFLRDTFLDWKKGSGEIRGIADDSTGLVVSIGYIDRNRDTSATLNTTELGTTGWFGAASETGGVFLFPPQTIEELLAQHESLPYAEIGMVVNYERGPPQPIVFQFVWNPENQQWLLNTVLFSNSRNQDARILPHF